MGPNKISQQFHAMFSIFWVVFFLGMGIFLLFFSQEFFIIDKAMRGIIGTTFILYGLFKIYVTYNLIVKAFFTRDEDDE